MNAEIAKAMLYMIDAGDTQEREEPFEKLCDLWKETGFTREAFIDTLSWLKREGYFEGNINLDFSGNAFIWDGKYAKLTDKGRERIEWMKSMEKPPLGLIPRYVRDTQRIAEILTAIERYADARMAVPEEWTDELRELLDRNARQMTGK